MPVGENGTVDIAQVQVELGKVATPFEHRSYGEELALCQRYYQKSYDQDSFAGDNTSQGCIDYVGSDVVNSGNLRMYRFQVPMREDAAVSVYTKNGTLNRLQRSDNSASYIDVTVSDQSSSGFSIKNTTTGVADYAYRGHYVADAEL